MLLLVMLLVLIDAGIFTMTGPPLKSCLITTSALVIAPHHSHLPRISSQISFPLLTTHNCILQEFLNSS